MFWQTYLNAQRALPAGERLMPDVRIFNGGGAPKPKTLHAEMMAEMGAPLIGGWGMTESPINTMVHVDDPDVKKANTDGRACPDVQIRIVLDGRECGPNEEGELRVKGPQVCLGYLDASLDAEAFDEDGWFRTGDLGVRDDGGWVSITGRLKDIIIRKGENISAKEIEDLLHAHPADRRRRGHRPARRPQRRAGVRGRGAARGPDADAAGDDRLPEGRSSCRPTRCPSNSRSSPPCRATPRARCSRKIYAQATEEQHEPLHRPPRRRHRAPVPASARPRPSCSPAEGAAVACVDLQGRRRHRCEHHRRRWHRVRRSTCDVSNAAEVQTSHRGRRRRARRARHAAQHRRHRPLLRGATRRTRTCSTRSSP